jgi:RNA polymerase sigma-70 factor (ECF subfamily)
MSRAIDPLEADLLRRLRADDLDAFEAFFARYRTLVYRTAYGLTGDHGAAEEILQDTFVQAYRHRSALRPDVSPVPWLHRVALNLTYSRLGRRRVPTRPFAELDATTLPDGASGPAERAEQEEARRAVRAGVSRLSPKHQGVVALYYLHGLTVSETATILGIRPGTVKSRLHYALGSLRTHLAAESRAGGAAEALPGRAAVVEAEAEPS